MPSPVVKRIARESLSNQFVHSMVVCGILIFMFLVTTLTSTLVSGFAGKIGFLITFCTVFIFVICPLFLGVLNFLRRLLWQQKDETIIIFKYFSNIKQYKRALRFVFSLGIRYLVTGVVLYFPCILIWMLSNERIYSSLNIPLPVWASNLWTLNSLLVLIATMAFVFITLKYYLSVFIFVSNDDIDIFEAINMSDIISKRTGADYFGLVLSFAGWLLSSVLVFPLIVVLPYFLTAYCAHSKFAITSYNKDVDVFNKTNTPSFSVEEI